MSAMETDKVPLEKGTHQEIFKKLGDNIGLDDGLIDALVISPAGRREPPRISFLIMGT